MEQQTTGKKNIYKKTLAMDLIKLGNNFSHSMRNKNNPKYQVFVFEDTPKLIEDILYITRRDRINRRYNSQRLYA